MIVRLWIVLGFVLAVTHPSREALGQAANTQSESATRGVRPTPASTQPTADLLRQRHDYAVLFATNDYDTWEPLVNPIPDAEAIAGALEKYYGFQAEVVRNPTRERIVSKLREYIQKDMGPADQLFIFFAGHGVFDDVVRQGYIVAKDSRKDDETRGSYESYDDLKQIVNSMHSRHVLLVLDACYSGTFDDQIRTRGTESYANLTLPELLGRKVTLMTRKFVTSGGKVYVPDGRPGHHSPFAAHLLEELETYGGPQGYITFANLLAGVQGTKPEPYWGQWGADQPGSEFFFIPKELVAKINEPTTPVVARDTPIRGDTASSSGRRPSIAVMGFSNVSAKPDSAWLSTALSEWLTTELGSSEKLRAVSGEDVARLKLDLALTDLSGYSNDTLARINKGLNARYVVSGSYTESGPESVRIDFWLQDTTNGETVQRAAENGSKANLTDLVGRVGARLRTRLGVEGATREEAKAVQAALPSNVESLRSYAEGLKKLRGYDLLGARDSLQRAVEADPKSALAHYALAKAWMELGYDSKTKLEAAAAKDLAGNLPPRNQRAIEGDNFRLNAEWERAIELYRSLWILYPDETDYALQLAATQTDAGKGQAALATLDELRRQSKEAADDPRVDYQEALAAASLRDLKRSEAASARSAERAAQQGAGLLAAEAYWQDCYALNRLGSPSAAEAACRRSSELGAGGIFEARSMTVLASIRSSQGRKADALELRRSALYLAREVGSRKDIIGALTNLANLQTSLGQLHEAEQNFDDAINIARDVGSRQQLARLELDKANLLWSEDKYTDAQRMFEEGKRDGEAVGDRGIVAMALKNSAVLLLTLGQLGKAEESVQQALAVARSSGIEASYASALRTEGDILLRKGDLQDARAVYSEALQFYRKFKDQQGISETGLSLANLSMDEDKAEEGATLAREALDAFRTQRLPELEASAREMLARALLAEGKREEALQEIKEAQAIADQNFVVRASVTVTAARVSAALGDLVGARQALDNCFNEAEGMKLGGVQLEIRLALAEVEQLSKAGTARAHLEALAQDARTSGYLLIAEKAEKLR